MSVRDVTGFVLGGHGDTMVPVVSYTNVAGIPVTQKIAADRLEEIVQRTRDGGAEVGKLLQKGSAFYAPSAGVAEMVDSIVLDQKRVLPCAALCQGEYGVDNLFVGVPVKLGAEGIEEIVEIELNDAEKEELQAKRGRGQGARRGDGEPVGPTPPRSAFRRSSDRSRLARRDASHERPARGGAQRPERRAELVAVVEARASVRRGERVLGARVGSRRSPSLPHRATGGVALLELPSHAEVDASQAERLSIFDPSRTGPTEP